MGIPAQKDQIAGAAHKTDTLEHIVTRGPVGIVVTQQNSVISRFAAGKVAILYAAMLSPHHFCIRRIISARKSDVDTFNMDIRPIGQLDASFLCGVFGQIHIVVPPGLEYDRS